MRFLDNLRIIFGFVAMLLAVGWYGALYVGIDLPAVIAARAPILAQATEKDPDTAERSVTVPLEGSEKAAPFSTHVVPGALVLLAIILLFVSGRRARHSGDSVE